MSETPQEPDARPETGHRRTLILLGIGSAVGLLLAAGAIVAPSPGPGAIPEDAVAVVNGVAIRRDDYLRLLVGLQNDSKSPLGPKDRAHVLDRMIDEELLVQRGLALGLAKVDRRIRADLTSSLIGSIVGTAEDRPPTDEELERFYAESRDFFVRPGRLRVEQIFFRVPIGGDEDPVLAKAARAREALQDGGSFESARAEFGDDEVSPIPDALLPELKLREYIGPTALRAAQTLEVGEVSAPVRSGVGVHVLRMVERTPAVTPPLAAIRPQVEAEWRRRAGDRALRAYLNQLRDDGDVEVLIEIEAEPTPAA